MTATTHTRLFVQLTSIAPNVEVLSVISETAKAYRVQNDNTAAACWLPKKGLVPRQSDHQSYENEFVIAPWFRRRLNYQQEQVLGVAE